MLFKAESKVQKDRAIMRETDARMAKYSRRGLVINFLAYILCLSLGDMHLLAPTTSVVLTTGLIITLLIRGYILIRFDALYSRGPSRWRSKFFVVTLIGAAWWSLILTALTLILGMESETPILWLYTVIFFSTTIQVTAPFQLFSRVYVIVALLPPALAAFYSGGFDGYMYGLMMVVFLVTLDHQAELLSKVHWQRLESNHALQQKARALESEMRKVDASVAINTNFLESLWQELNNSYQDLQALFDSTDKDNQTPDQLERSTKAEAALEKQKFLLSNTRIFAHINNREVEVNACVFPLRSLLERWVDEFQEDATRSHINLSHRVHPECPESVKGDPKLIGRIVGNLLGNAVQHSDEGDIFVDFDFRACKGEIGYLETTIIDQGVKLGVENLENPEQFATSSRFSGLWYPICKSLAESLGGTIETDFNGKEIHYLLRLPVTMVEQEAAA